MSKLQERNKFDLSSLSFNCGKIGHLAVGNIIPVLPGDSIEMLAVGSIRLAPFRQNLVLDAQLDTFSFFVPDRLAFCKKASNDEVLADPTANDLGLWQEFITKRGVGVTLPKIAYPEFMHFQDSDKTKPVIQNALQAYCWIYNRFFRFKDQPNKNINNLPAYNTDEGLYGLTTPRLPRLWTTGMLSDGDDSVGDVTFDTSGSSGKFNLVDMASTAMDFTQERRKAFFGTYYSDLMKSTFGVSTSSAIDLRPTLLAHTSEWLSGHNIFGTADNNLGNAVGRVEAQAAHGFPRKFFSEHGTILTLQLVRFPSVATTECNPLISSPDAGGYKYRSGDPGIAETEKPVLMNAEDLYGGSASTPVTYAPYYDWYRNNPNIVHRQLRRVTGHPFVNALTLNSSNSRQYMNKEMDTAFSTLAMGHWNSSMRFNVAVLRNLPGGISSIYAGTSKGKK